MKKLISAIVIIAMCAASLAACSKNEVPSGMTAAYNSAAPYKLYVPNGWTVDASSAITATAYSRTSDPLSVTVTLANATDAAATDYFLSYRVSFESVYEDFAAEEPESVLLDGKAADKFVYTGNLTNGDTVNKYKFTQYISKYNGKFYIITFASGASSFDGYSDTIAEIIGNFKFAEPQPVTGTDSDVPVAPDKMKYAANEIVDYDFFVPEDWETDMSTGAVTAYTDGGKTSVSVTAWDVPYMVNVVSDWRKNYAADMAMISDDFTEISSEETTLDNFAAMKYVSSATLAGEKFAYTQIAVARKYMIYLITFTTTDASGEHSAEFDAMLANFKFDK